MRVDRSLQKINYIKFASFCVVLVILSTLIILFGIMPSTKAYKAAQIIGNDKLINLSKIEQLHSIESARLDTLLSEHERILTAITTPYNETHFRSIAEQYFTELNITDITDTAQNEPSPVPASSTTFAKPSAPTTTDPSKNPNAPIAHDTNNAAHSKTSSLSAISNATAVSSSEKYLSKTLKLDGNISTPARLFAYINELQSSPNIVKIDFPITMRQEKGYIFVSLVARIYYTPNAVVSPKMDAEMTDSEPASDADSASDGGGMPASGTNNASEGDATEPATNGANPS